MKKQSPQHPPYAAPSSVGSRFQNTFSQAPLLFVGIGLCVLAGTVLVVAPAVFSVSYNMHTATSTDAALAAVNSGTSSVKEVTGNDMPTSPPVLHIATPTSVRAIYMTQCVVGTVDFRARLVKLIDETELNSVVIDLKDYTGKLAFQSDDPALAPSVSEKCGARDMKTFVETLHQKGVYVIGRITVFQDPYYASVHPELAVRSIATGGSWHDNKGLAFIDVGAKPYWDYIVKISMAAHALGFDELNYDYVRFPSDGPMKDASYTWDKGMSKAEALEHFFVYLHNRIQDPAAYASGDTPPKTSADLFGMVCTNTDDLNIGQVLERALPYFDFIDPMVYPSHFPTGFHNWKNPNAYPYELIKFTMESAVRRTTATVTSVETLGATPVYKDVIVPAKKVGTTTIATSTKKVIDGYTKEAYPATKIRPWLQDFSLGTPRYGIAEVRAQIQATYDAGLSSWLMWSAANTYTLGAFESN